MQNTRLSSLIDRSLSGFVTFFRNPWRRQSLLIISLLGGNFIATVASTIAGQRATLDVVVSLLLVVMTEVVSWLVYRENRDIRNNQRQPLSARRSLLLEILNGVKIGMIYGLFVEAFKLGS